MVLLSPWAAFTLLQVEMDALADLHVNPEDVLGERGARLIDALISRPDWEQRFELLDDVFTAWLGSGHAWSPRVRWAYDRLFRCGGNIPIRRLAEDVGWHMRHLEDKFREQIGLSPKATARMFRFRRAVRLISNERTLAEAAALCGFSDQTHMTREFKAITGRTPGELRAAFDGPDGLMHRAVRQFTAQQDGSLLSLAL
jgi:AraC-like DNA-binding protein